MTERVKIPRTIEALRRSLTEDDGIVVAKEWGRAAKVWAFTYDAGRGGDHRSNDGFPSLLTVTAFAGLGIVGLTNRETVAHYRAAWQAAIDQGAAQEVKPGQAPTLPDLPWPPNPTVGRNVPPERREALERAARDDGVGSSKVVDVASNPRAVAAAMKGDPEFAERVMGDPEARTAAMNAALSVDEKKAKAAGRSAPPERAREAGAFGALLFAGDIRKALPVLRAARKDAESHNLRVWQDDEREMCLEAIGEVMAELELLKMLVNGTVTDDELAAFMKGD